MFKDIKKKAKEKAGEIKEASSGITGTVTNQAKTISDSASEIASGAVKSAANVASTAGKMAKSTVDSMIITLATKIIIKSMKSAGDKGTSYIFNDEKYEKFIGRTWEILPLPIRLVGKESLGYNPAMFTLRKLVFGKDKEEPKIDKQDENIIKKTIKGMFS